LISAAPEGQLAGRRALITGSTSGIGRSTARLFASEGATVIISGRDAGRGEQTVEAITSHGGRARFVQADLGHIDGVRRLAQEAGDVDVLVNNAALSVYAPAVEQDPESFELSFATNVRAPFVLVQELAPGMVARGSGSIINVSTFAASIAIPGLSVYSATKAALNSLTRTWAAEFGAAGVRVNTIASGPVRTESVIAAMGEEMAQQVGATTLLGRLAAGDEIAEVALFLASDRASYLTGATIAVDAGRTAL